MQLASSWTRARVKAGLFAPPRNTASADQAGSSRACLGIACFIDGISCQKWYLFRSFFGISILGMDFFRDLCIGTGFLEPQIAPEPPARPGHCRRISKSSSFARITGPRMLILLQAQISKKSGICPYNRTTDADPVKGANTKLFRPPLRALPGRSRMLPGFKIDAFPVSYTHLTLPTSDLV